MEITILLYIYLYIFLILRIYIIIIIILYIVICTLNINEKHSSVHHSTLRYILTKNNEIKSFIQKHIWYIKWVFYFLRVYYTNDCTLQFFEPDNFILVNISALRDQRRYLVPTRRQRSPIIRAKVFSRKLILECR